MPLVMWIKSFIILAFIFPIQRENLLRKAFNVLKYQTLSLQKRLFYSTKMLQLLQKNVNLKFIAF